MIFDDKPRERITIQTLQKLKSNNETIAMLSIYDYALAQLAQKAGVEIIVVGDSLGMTMLGYKNTLPVSMDQMISHASAAKRGAPECFVVGDMPFMSYQQSDRDAVINAGRFIKEAGCEAVKCEASLKLMSRFRAIADSETMVMGHIGLNPQKIHEMGGYRIQGKNWESTRELLETALALEEAGAFALLLEGVTEEAANLIKSKLKIPVYGIGSGRNLDGQLLIGHDPLGLYFGFKKLPSYIKQYYPKADGTKTIGRLIFDVFSQYVEDVKRGKFPAQKNVHHIENSEWKIILKKFKVKGKSWKIHE